MKPNRGTIIIAVLVLLEAGAYAGPDTRNRIRDLKSRDKAVVVSAIAGLAADPADESSAALVGHLKTEQDAYVRIRVIEALTVRQSAAARAAVIEALNDKNPQVRQAAAANLAYFAPGQDITTAIAAAAGKDTGRAFTLNAVNTLSRSNDDRAAGAIGSLCDKEKDAATRRSELRALGRMGTPKAMAELKRFETDRNKEVRDEAKALLAAPKAAGPARPKKR